VTPHFLPTQGARFRAWHHTLKGVHARSDRITCCCRFLHWPHALEPRPACSRKHDSMSTPSERDVASGSSRSRKSSTSRRTRSPTHARLRSGVGESGTYACAALARSDHCSPCPCPAVCVSPRTRNVRSTKRVARFCQRHATRC
jgi:hypothetical protein